MSATTPRPAALRAILIGFFLVPTLAHSLYQPRHLFDFAKRDSCDTASLDASCTTSLTECVDAICAACADVASIESCCQLSTVDDISNCIVSDTSSTTAASAPATTTAAPVITPSPSSAGGDADSMACNNFESMLTSCEVQTPHFTDLAFSNQATCLCYTSDVWNPQVYDGYWSSCLGYLSTVTPAGYSSIINDNGFYIDPCREAGDVAQPASAAASTTSNPGGASSFPQSTSEPGLPRATSQTNTAPSVVTVTGPVPTSSSNSANNLGIHQALLALMLPAVLVL